MKANKQTGSLYALVNVVLLVYLLAALYVEHFSEIPRGDFTDYVCQIIPVYVPPVALVLFLYGLWNVRTYRYWVLLPVASFLLSFCFPATISFWLLHGWVPGQ
jgi:hypothetical protein